MKRAALAAICCALLLTGCGGRMQTVLGDLLQAEPTPQQPQTLRLDAPEDGQFWYYYDCLSEQEQALYLQLCAAVESFQPTVQEGFSGLCVEQVCQVVDCVGFDHPEYFWLSDGFRYYYVEDTMVRVELTYLYDEAQVRHMQAQIEEAVAELCPTLAPDAPAFDRYVALHDALVQWVRYDDAGGQADPAALSNLYGALVERTALCGGYAKAYQYLCTQAGLEASFLTGQADGVDHAWNFVRLDGVYYEVDVTWDDPVGQTQAGAVSHDYCLADAALMRQTHTPEGRWLPDDTGQTDTYFRHQALYLEHDTPQALAQILCTAVAAGEAAVTVQFATAQAAELACARLTEQGEIYAILAQAQQENAALVTDAVSYSRNVPMHTVTIYLQYRKIDTGN